MFGRQRAGGCQRSEVCMRLYTVYAYVYKSIHIYMRTNVYTYKFICTNKRKQHKRRYCISAYSSVELAIKLDLLAFQASCK